MPIDPNWRKKAHDKIDEVLGIPCLIKPMKPAETAGKPDPFKTGGPDPDREIRTKVGLFVKKEEAPKAFPGMMMEDVKADMFIAMQSSYIGDLARGDQIEFTSPLGRSYKTEVNYLFDDDTGQTIIHLLMVRS